MDDDLFLDWYKELKISDGGNLPHMDQELTFQYVTFRLCDSLPQSKLKELQERKAYFLKDNPKPWDKETYIRYWNLVGKEEDRLLDNGYGSCVLADPTARKILINSIHHYDGIRYSIYAYVIMPNHVHMILLPLEGQKLDTIMQSIKGFSARQINKKTGRKGKLWMRENFDRLVRSEEDLRHKRCYIERNPRFLPKSSYTLYIKDF